jgi:hypothetical protein
MPEENFYKVHFSAIEAGSGLQYSDHEVVYANSVEDAKSICTQWLQANWQEVSSFKIVFVTDEEGNAL